MLSHFFKNKEKSIGLKAIAGFLLMTATIFALFAFYQWLHIDIMFSSAGAALITALVSGFTALLVYFSASHFAEKSQDPISRLETELEKLAFAFLEGLMAEKNPTNANEEESTENVENISSIHQSPGKTSRH